MDFKIKKIISAMKVINFAKYRNLHKIAGVRLAHFAYAVEGVGKAVDELFDKVSE